MKCLSLSDCHLAVSQSWASYYTSSERGESELSADKKILNFFSAKWLLILYTLDHLKVRVFFGRLSRAGVDQARSTFWSVTQSLLVGS